MWRFQDSQDSITIGRTMLGWPLSLTLSFHPPFSRGHGERVSEALGWQTDFVMDGVGETGAETLPSRPPSSGAGLGVAYFSLRELGWATTKSNGFIWNSRLLSYAQPRPRKRKKKRKKKKKKGAACLPAAHPLSVASVPREKAAVSCGCEK